MNNMFEYPFEKYHFYVGPNKVIATSTYAGKTVRGVAKCSKDDIFDIEKGKQLAAARCAKRIADKRMNRAYAARERAYHEVAKAYAKLKDMEDYVYDAKVAQEKENNHIQMLLDRM